jgi:glyoxylate reductase
MKKKILITREIPKKAVSMLKKNGFWVTIGNSKKPLNEKEIISLLSKDNYDGVITLLTEKISSKIFKKFPNIKIYSNYATGFDNFDIDEANNLGITLCNSPAKKSADAVAEHTVALIFTLAKKIIPAHRFTQKGGYLGFDPMLFIDTGLKEKTLGLIGLGQIGKQVAKDSINVGFNIIYFDIRRDKNFEKETKATYKKTIDEVIKKSDFISLHIPLNKHTYHLINKTRLLQMKDTAFLINTSRGAVIDEKALVSVLSEKKIRGVALDVFEDEPKIPSLLKKLDNVVLTPHIASATKEARDEMAEIAAQNIIDFFKGHKPKYIINKK